MEEQRLKEREEAVRRREEEVERREEELRRREVVSPLKDSERKKGLFASKSENYSFSKII